MSLRNAIATSPMSAFQWSIVVIAAIMNLLDGFDVHRHSSRICFERC